MDYIEFVKEYRNLACRYADAAIRLQEPGNQAMTGGSSSRTPITPGKGGGISCRQRYKLSMLPESDKILIDCLLYSFSHPDTNYIDLYIEKMGLTDVKRIADDIVNRCKENTE